MFIPEDAPEVTVREIAFHGARVFRVNGLINACAKIVRDGSERMDWHDLSTLEEPYRIEGKKTMGLELAEQLGWSLPDVISLTPSVFQNCQRRTGAVLNSF